MGQKSDSEILIMNKRKHLPKQAYKEDSLTANDANGTVPASATKREERGDETRKRGPIGSCFLVSFHLGQYFPVVPVGGLDAVLNTTVPKSDSLLDVVFGVIVLLDNQEHLF